MAKDKAQIEVWSEWVIVKTTFLWLPIAAFIQIIKKLRQK